MRPTTPGLSTIVATPYLLLIIIPNSGLLSIGLLSGYIAILEHCTTSLRGTPLAPGTSNSVEKFLIYINLGISTHILERLMLLILRLRPSTSGIIFINPVSISHIS